MLKNENNENEKILILHAIPSIRTRLRIQSRNNSKKPSLSNSIVIPINSFKIIFKDKLDRWKEFLREFT